MMPIQLLSAANSALGNLGVDPATIALGVVGLVVLIAFCIGFAKGVRQIGWGGLVWVGAVALFLFCHDEFGARLTENIRMTITSAEGEVFDISALVLFVLAILCILAVLIVYGILSLIFRGKTARKIKMRGPRELDEFGGEYDDDDDFEEDDEKYEAVVANERMNPNLLGRFLGGIFAALTAVMVLAVIICIAALIIDSTELKTTLASLYEISIGEDKMLMTVVLDIAKQWAMDVLAIGLMILVASRGRDKGLLESLRILVTQVGNIVAIILALYIPFSASVVGEGADPSNFLYQYVMFFVNAIVPAMGPEMEIVSPIIGQLVSGIVLAVAVTIVMVILNALWLKFNYRVRKVAFFRLLDGSVSCVVYLIIGAVAVAGMWAVLIALDVYKVLDVSSLFNETSPISCVMHNVCKVFVEPFLESIAALG